MRRGILTGLLAGGLLVGGSVVAAPAAHAAPPVEAVVSICQAIGRGIAYDIGATCDFRIYNPTGDVSVTKASRQYRLLSALPGWRVIVDATGRADADGMISVFVRMVPDA